MCNAKVAHAKKGTCEKHVCRNDRDFILKQNREIALKIVRLLPSTYYWFCCQKSLTLKRLKYVPDTQYNTNTHTQLWCEWSFQNTLRHSCMDDGALLAVIYKACFWRNINKIIKITMWIVDPIPGQAMKIPLDHQLCLMISGPWSYVLVLRSQDLCI